MGKGYVPFSVNHDGKCNTCKKKKPLDEMLMLEKGLYHCIDCETGLYGDRFDMLSDMPMTDESIGKIQKLLRWCFG